MAESSGNQIQKNFIFRVRALKFSIRDDRNFTGGKSYRSFRCRVRGLMLPIRDDRNFREQNSEKVQI